MVSILEGVRPYPIWVRGPVQGAGRDPGSNPGLGLFFFSLFLSYFFIFIIYLKGRLAEGQSITASKF